LILVLVNKLRLKLVLLRMVLTLGKLVRLVEGARVKVGLRVR
jgi:hypothetical protein